MNKLFLAGMIAVAFTSSCADKKPDHDNSLVTSEPQAEALVKDSNSIITTPSGQANITLPSATAGTANPAAQAAQVVTSAPTGGTTAPGMNPPHGQPGHKCEIAVGAPLNSAPAGKGAQAVSTSGSPVISSSPAITAPTTATPAPITAPTVTAPGMNPPHGQPGHDCAIAVGAPLKKN